MGVSIHNLAVLRASVEGVHLGTYFGALGALPHWIESTRALGWIDSDGKPTEFGTQLARSLALAGQGAGRAYLWRDADALVAKAATLAMEKNS